MTGMRLPVRVDLRENVEAVAQRRAPGVFAWLRWPVFNESLLLEYTHTRTRAPARTRKHTMADTHTNAYTLGTHSRTHNTILKYDSIQRRHARTQHYGPDTALEITLKTRWECRKIGTRPQAYLLLQVQPSAMIARRARTPARRVRACLTQSRTEGEILL